MNYLTYGTRPADGGVARVKSTFPNVFMWQIQGNIGNDSGCSADGCFFKGMSGITKILFHGIGSGVNPVHCA
jgi:hypothetical protein